MNREMDETDRKHCLLDLHAIREMGDPVIGSAEFLLKWRDGLETVLNEEPEGERVDHDELAKLEAELQTSDDAVIAMTNGVERAVLAIDKICENPDLGSDLTTDLDAIAVALGELL